MAISPRRSPRSSRVIPFLIGGLSVLTAFVGPLGPGRAGAAGSAAASTSANPSSSLASSSGPNATKALNDARATFGIGPLGASASDNRTFFSYQMGPGGQYSDRAVVVNYGITSLQLSVFAADLGNSSDGGISVGLQNDQPQDAGAWVRLAGKTLTAQVPPRTKNGPGQVVVPFTVVVPRNASPGDHGAAIVAELSTLGKNPQGQNVKLDQRVASRIYLRVNGALHPKLSIDNLKVSYRQSLNPIGGGAALVTYTVHNAGNVRLSAQQAVSVTGMFGLKSKVVTPAGVQLLFPGGSQQVSVRVSGVFPSVFEKSHVTVTPQLFSDQSKMAVPVAAASASFTAIPWMLMLSLLGLILLGVLIWYLRKRSKGKPQAKHGKGNNPNKPGPNRPTTPTRTPETIGS